MKTFLVVIPTREDHPDHPDHPDDHPDDHPRVLGEAADPECQRPCVQRIMGLRGPDCQGGGSQGPLQR